MRIAQVRIENLRSFRDETIHLGNYTCCVGPNGAGKSTILNALRLFFRDSADGTVLKINEDDYHKRNISQPIRVTVTFTDLEDDARDDLKHYVRQDQLVVTGEATWSISTRSAIMVQYGQRLGIAQFADFFRMEGDRGKAEELKREYENLRQKFSGLPKATTKQAMVDALRAYEAEHRAECALLRSEDEFYGISKGKDRLGKYIQWVHIPAVKDASTEQIEGRRTALSQLLERTVRSRVSFDGPLDAIRQKATADYRKLLDQNQEILGTLSNSLNKKIREWAHPEAHLELIWHSDPDDSVKLADPLAEVIAGEGLFHGKLSLFGHGLQRSFLIALLQELAEMNGGSGSTLILACEEPELYQHPPQARHLASVFERLSNTSKVQVLATTHSPLFVSGKGFSDLRLIRRSPDHETSSRQFTFDRLAELVAKATGETPISPEGTALKVNQVLCSTINEMFFSNVAVLVEGQEDAAYLTGFLTISGSMTEFRRLGCHVIAMPTSGKTFLMNTAAVAHGFGIPIYVVFDADTDKLEKLEKSGNKNKHEKENLAIQRLCGVTDPVAFPKETLWYPNLTAWSSDIGGTCAEDYGGKGGWQKLQDRVRVKYDVEDVADLNKNLIFIGYMLAEAWDEGKRFASLEQLTKAILAFASSVADKNAGETRTSAPNTVLK